MEGGLARMPEYLGQSWGTSPDPYLVPRVGSERASHSYFSMPLAALGKPLSCLCRERGFDQQNTHLPAYGEYAEGRSGAVLVATI